LGGPGGRGGGEVDQVPEHTMTIRIPKEKFKMGVTLTRKVRTQGSDEENAT
jgi:hypothetical protein